MKKYFPALAVFLCFVITISCFSFKSCSSYVDVPLSKDNFSNYLYLQVSFDNYTVIDNPDYIPGTSTFLESGRRYIEVYSKNYSTFSVSPSFEFIDVEITYAFPSSSFGLLLPNTQTVSVCNDGRSFFTQGYNASTSTPKPPTTPEEITFVHSVKGFVRVYK